MRLVILLSILALLCGCGQHREAAIAAANISAMAETVQHPLADEIALSAEAIKVQLDEDAEPSAELVAALQANDTPAAEQAAMAQVSEVDKETAQNRAIGNLATWGWGWLVSSVPLLGAAGALWQKARKWRTAAGMAAKLADDLRQNKPDDFGSVLELAKNEQTQAGVRELIREVRGRK